MAGVHARSEGEMMNDECDGHECDCQEPCGPISIGCLVIDDSNLRCIRSLAELAERYAPGTVVLVTEDEGRTFRKVTVQCRGHRWKKGKR